MSKKNNEQMKFVEATINALNGIKESFIKTKKQMEDNKVVSSALPFLVIHMNYTVDIVEQYIKQYNDFKKSMEEK